MTTQTTRQRLPKAAITRTLNRAQLADFITTQFGKDVLVTFLRSDMIDFAYALHVQGFGLDVCTPLTGSVLLGEDDITSERMTLIVSMAGA